MLLKKIILLTLALGSASLVLAGDLLVTWPAVKEAELYSIQHGTSNIIIRVTTSNTSLRIENVVEGRTYYITIKSIRGALTSENSTIMHFTVPNSKPVKPLGAPSKIKIIYNE